MFGGLPALIGPFLEYLRPTRSPYLVIAFFSVLVVCIKIDKSFRTAAGADVPEFFIPIFALLLAIIPLSLVQRKLPLATQDSVQEPEKAEAAKLANSKFENDLDSVFKFSRALCLSVAIVMLFFYTETKLTQSIYVRLAYWIIIIQLATFLAYMAFKHFSDEDTSNLNLFQIAVITAVFFVGSTFIAMKLEMKERDVLYFYYCDKLETAPKAASAVSIPCSAKAPFDSKVTEVFEVYSLDYRQLSFVFFGSCWLVYEIFWLITLYRVARPAKKKAAEPLSPNTESTSAPS